MFYKRTAIPHCKISCKPKPKLRYWIRSNFNNIFLDKLVLIDYNICYMHNNIISIFIICLLYLLTALHKNSHWRIWCWLKNVMDWWSGNIKCVMQHTHQSISINSFLSSWTYLQMKEFAKSKVRINFTIYCLFLIFS